MSQILNTRIGVIGAGTMGQALIKGLLARQMPRRYLIAADSDSQTRRVVRRRFTIAVTSEVDHVVATSDVIVLAVKPQQVGDLIDEIAPQISRRQLVISIAAGIRLRWLQHRLPGVPVIRVMPNLPATVGSGFAAIAAGRLAMPAHRAITASLFGAVGKVVELPERQFDAITAISGSGPAYVFFLVHAWTTAARQLGLPASVATLAIAQTLEGSVKLLRAAGAPVDALIAQVASTGGTTEAALRVLASRRVAAHVAEAIQAAARRSRGLSWA